MTTNNRGSTDGRQFKRASVALVAFVFLYVTVRLVFLAHDALVLPFILQCIVWILLAELAAILGWIAWTGWRLYRALPPPFEQATSRDGDEKNRVLLSRYVDNDSLLAPSDDQVAADLLKRLRKAEEHYNGDGGGWMTDFRNFQTRQDEAAQKIAKATAIRIAATTVTSRWSVVDMALTLYLSSKMIADIATLYNRRITSRQSFRLAIGWATGVAVSGQMGETAGRIGTAVGTASGNWLSSVLEECFSGDKIAGTIGKQLGTGIGFAFGKLAEGAANAFLALRLGNRAIQDFHALADK